jgi:hypothetical protein
MILKIKIGRGARGLLSYISQPSKTAHNNTRPFYSNMAGATPRELSAEVAALRKLKPNLTRAVGHLMISPDQKDRQLSQVEWEKAIDIALAEHGASEAAFAGYVHRDTGCAHAHVFFLRVLPDGEVVSDSHNFRKNEAAARFIEKELNLISLTPSENPPGNRDAVANASRRAGRLGTIDAGKIQAAAVRLAVQDARDIDHLLELLHAQGIQAEFDRRGAAQQVYGWRVRKKGADEWFKASTLAKDLSWPKIAHRFAKDHAQAYSAQAKPATSEPKRTLTPKPQQQYTCAAQTTKWRLDTSKASSEQYIPGSVGPVFQACLLLTAEAINLMIALWEKIVAFLKNILAKLGIGAVASPGNQLVLEPIPPLDAEARFVDEPLLIGHAAESIGQVAAAIAKRDPSLLPAGPGREELVAAMNNEFAEQGSSEKKEPFGFMPHADQEHENIVAAPTPSPFSMFLAAKTKHHEAQAATKAAMDVDSGSGDIWTGHEVRDDKEKELQAAIARLQSLKNNSKTWLNQSFKNRLKAKITGTPHDEAAAQAQVKVTKLTAELRGVGPATPRYTREEVLSIKAAQTTEKTAAESIHRAKIEVIAAARAALGSTPNAEALLETVRKSGYDEAKMRAALIAVKNATDVERRRQNPDAYDDETSAGRLLDEMADAPKA